MCTYLWYTGLCGKPQNIITKRNGDSRDIIYSIGILQGSINVYIYIYIYIDDKIRLDAGGTFQYMYTGNVFAWMDYDYLPQDSSSLGISNYLPQDYKH